MLHIVLFEPRIPQNTGNIGRLCVASGTTLHLIHPLGFSTSQKELKRAGMDYWSRLLVCEWSNIEHFWESHPFGLGHFLVSTKAKTPYFDIVFSPDSYFYFGREDAGVPIAIHERFATQSLVIPMVDGERSINLATACGIVLYEAIRQIGLP